MTGNGGSGISRGGGSPILELQRVTKVYRMGSVEVAALAGVTLSVQSGDMLAIMGPSGSGKSTLMNIIGCLDVPTSGEYLLAGEDVGSLGDNRLAEIRSKRIGFVFQTYNLLPRSTALENVELPLLYSNGRDNRRRAMEALDRVGLAHRARHRPTELSGGEQQRVGIARALANAPTILLADEPTGNLDTRSSEDIMAVLQGLNREEGLTLIIVTHETDISQHTRRVVSLRDGLVVGDEPVASPRLAAARAPGEGVAP
jgi:putative ABC transport system ATP-binding protein